MDLRRFRIRNSVASRMTDSASFSLFFSGLDGGIARIGMHTTVGFTTFPVGGTITQKWGESPGGSEYGSGANPTDFSASDGGNLYLEVTRDGETASAVVPVRHVAPTLTGALSDQTFYGDNGFSAHDVSSEFEGNNISFSLVVAVAGFSIDPGTGVLTIDKSVTKLITNQSVTVRASNSGGYAEDTLAVTVAAINLSIVGLDGSVARIGSHGTIGYSLTPSSGDISQKWGSTPGGAEYGTFANPSDFAASDGASLYLAVTRDGSVVSTSAPVLYPMPVAAGGLGSWTIEQADNGTAVLDTSVDFTADGETYEAYPTGFPVGTPLPTGFTFETSTGELMADQTAIALQTDTPITIECTNSGGSALSLLTVTVTQSPAFDVTIDTGGAIVGTADIGAGTYTIISPAQLSGVYPVDFTQLLSNGTPLILRLPTDEGSTLVGEMRNRKDAGIWLSNPEFDPSGITVVEQWTRDDMDIPGQTDPDLYINSVADKGTTIRIRETATGIESAKQASASSNGSFIPAVFNPNELGSALLLQIDPSVPASLYTDTGATQPVSNDNEPVSFVRDRSPNAYGLSGATAGRTWSGPPTYKSSNGLHWVEYAPGDGLGAAEAFTMLNASGMNFYVALETSDTSFLLAGSEDSGSNWMGAAKSGQTDSPQNNAGTPTYHVNGGSALVPVQTGTLSANWATGLPVVAEARGVDFTGSAFWTDANGFLPMLYNTTAVGLEFSGKLYGYIVTDGTETAQQRAEIVAWLQQKMGV